MPGHPPVSVPVPVPVPVPMSVPVSVPVSRPATCPAGGPGPAGYFVTAKCRRIAAVRSGSPSVFTRSATASGVTRPQARRT